MNTGTDDGLAPSARLHPSARRSRVRLAVGGAIVLVVAAICTAVVASLFGGAGDRTVITGSVLPTALAPASTASSAAPPALFVHVLGAVSHPGLYELSRGARVVDVVAAAGGFTVEADQGGVNLARLVGDGEQLYVPRVGEAPPPAASVTTGQPSGPIDLNSATAEQLDGLPHIGPALAQRILDWREANGRFDSVEDLRNVAGIGEKVFADLKDLVTV